MKNFIIASLFILTAMGLFAFVTPAEKQNVEAESPTWLVIDGELIDDGWYDCVTICGDYLCDRMPLTRLLV